MRPVGDENAWDEITTADLRARGSLKWTKYADGGSSDHASDMIGAFVAEMDFGAAPAVVAALHQAVDTAEFGYLPSWRAAELAQACAQWQRQRYGWQVGAEQVFPLADVLTALEVTMRHFARPGTPLILPTPAYMPFVTIPPLHGREIIEVPMARDGQRYVLDLDGIDQAYRAGGDLLILCNPANPVGRVLTAEELAGVTEVVDRHGGMVFADEVHAPLVFPGHHHIPYAATSPTAAAHTLTATSASKGWNLPGLRCAQVILDPAQVPVWRRVGTTATVMASTLGTVASTAAYRHGGDWLDQVVAYLDRNRQAFGELLAEHLPQVGYHPPEGTYLAWLDCRQLDTTGPLDEYFRERAGVALVDGSECGAAGRGHVRLNLATPLPVLRQAVTRMAAI